MEDDLNTRAKHGIVTETHTSPASYRFKFGIRKFLGLVVAVIVAHFRRAPQSLSG